MISGARPTVRIGRRFACEADGKRSRAASCVRGPTAKIAGLVCAVDTREGTHAQTRARTRRAGRKATMEAHGLVPRSTLLRKTASARRKHPGARTQTASATPNQISARVEDP